jgi:hypothetical protein
VVPLGQAMTKNMYAGKTAAECVAQPTAPPLLRSLHLEIPASFLESLDAKTPRSFKGE